MMVGENSYFGAKVAQAHIMDWQMKGRFQMLVSNQCKTLGGIFLDSIYHEKLSKRK